MKRAYTLFTLLVATLILSTSISATAQKKNKKGGKERENLVEATAVETIEEYTTKVLSSFMSFYGLGLDEKLYLQTDKPYYSSGESIWIKGYLLNAINHTPLNVTNFIYAELISESGTLASRVKIQRDSAGFNGYIKLDPMMTPGNYSLRGYTKWMANKESDFFHSKPLKIVSPVSSLLPTESAVDPELSERQQAKAKQLAEEEAAKAKEAENQILDYDVQFFPEGGALLAGVGQIVAFKSIATDGLSKEITGSVYNSQDVLVGEIKSMHKGMGMMQMMAEAGESYYAVTMSDDGLERHFDLPAVETQGVALQVIRTPSGANYQIHATAPELLDGAHVIIHSRGKIIAATKAVASKASAISATQLLDGVSTISVVDANNKIISERVIFKRPTALPTMTFQPSAQNYAKRSLAMVSVNVKSSAGAPTKGDFAVSVTDNASVKFDPATESMLSYLLLSSEIKGHIEDPGLYFSESGAAADAKLDLLMRTQGWRRFDLETILNGTVKQPKELYEDVAHITGKVKGFFGNAARRPKIAVLCSKVNFLDVFDLDESSTFRLAGLNIPDSTTYIVRAQGRNGANTLTLKIEPEIFPLITPEIFERKKFEKSVPFEFVNQSTEKFIHDGGMKTIELESISVVTSKASAAENGGISATQSHGRENLETMSGLTLGDIIQTISGMKISMEEGAESVIYRSATEPVRFIVDGVDTEYLNISNLMADDMEQLDFFSGAEAAVFSDSSGGVISITQRAVRTNTAPPLPNIAYVSQLGYQQPAKFYQPSYELADVVKNSPPDLRSTVYWNGDLKADSAGNIKFAFYTADKPTTYTVTIEGITDEGEVCYGTTTLQRTSNK